MRVFFRFVAKGNEVAAVGPFKIIDGAGVRLDGRPHEMVAVLAQQDTQSRPLIKRGVIVEGPIQIDCPAEVEHQPPVQNLKGHKGGLVDVLARTLLLRGQVADQLAAEVDVEAAAVTEFRVRLPHIADM